MQTLKDPQFPDFSKQGYQIIRELGHNFSGGRATYLATELATGQSVVIKLFSFSSSSASWSNYNTLQREIEVLQRLDHPGIPKYLETIKTPVGFCLVQEYKNANSLEVSRHFNTKDIHLIAAGVLETLVYLQQQVPPVIHRDIKPGNILVDSDFNVFLVDFGFASSSDREIAASSVVKGTLGFMAPEQLFGRQLCAASDLYGLGITLICLLTGTLSTEIGKLIDDDYRIRWEPMVPTLNPSFVKWLGKMVVPKLGNRFTDAVTALNALQSLECTTGSNNDSGALLWEHRNELVLQEQLFLKEDKDDEYTALETRTSFLSKVGKKVGKWVAPALIVGTLVTGAIGISTLHQIPALPPLIIIPTVHLFFRILRIVITLTIIIGLIRTTYLVNHDEEWMPTATLVIIIFTMVTVIDGGVAMAILLSS